MKLLSTLFFLLPFIGSGQIVAWDFTGESQLPTSTAEIINPNLTSSGLLTRGPNAVESAGVNSFRTVGFQNDGIAVTNQDYFQTTMQASPGYTLSLSTIDGRVAGTATYSNSPGVTMQFAYSLDGTTFTLIGAPIVQVGTGNLAQVDVSGVTALQGVPNGTTVTIRFYASGQTATGGWGFNSNLPGVNGLAFGGTLTPAGGCNTFNTISASACNTYTSPSGQVFTSSGTYNDTIPNAALCDSILTINLTINPSYSGLTSSATICTGQTYTFGTQSLTTAGTYTETLQTAAGCDSTVNLTLSVVSSFSTSIADTICQGESYPFGSQTLTMSGTYIDSLMSVAGCDSIITLVLTVSPASSNTITIIACDTYVSPSGLYTWTSSGIYMDTLQNINGCDSVLTINLTIGQSYLSTTTDEACDSYTFFGTTYTQSGTYEVVYTNASGCDSTLQLVLTITETPATPITSGDQTVCIPALPGDITVQPAAAVPSLIITGVMDGPFVGGQPKAITFYAINDIPDLSLYGFGSANNGEGTDGQEHTFPVVALSAGDEYIVTTNGGEFTTFFDGLVADETVTSAANVNGDDAIELFFNGTVIDVFGEINVDGSGQPWDYLDGWAYRNTNAQPNNGVFTISEWSFSGIDMFDNQTSNATSPNPFPISTFTTPSSAIQFMWYSDVALTDLLATGETFATGQTAAGSEDYFVVASANGCISDAAVVEITINTPPSVSLALPVTFACVNHPTITLSGATPAGGTFSGPGVTGTSFSPASAGAGSHTITYQVTANGCIGQATDIIEVNACASIDELNSSIVTVYPNPTSGIVTVQQEGAELLNVELIDIAGKRVMLTQLSEAINTIDISKLDAGSYFIIVNSDNQVQRIQLVKK